MIMEPRTILLVGKTGEGKSSTGNTILGKTVFNSKASANAVTPKSVRGDGMFDRRKITVIDTPGFFDTDRDEMEIKSEIAKALIECAPDVHAIVMVVKVGRYTKHENETVQQIVSMMTEEALKHTVILFTFGEQLEGQTIEEFVKANSKLQEVVDKCGGRCHVIDNKYWTEDASGDKSNRVQVKNLLETIDKMVKDNGCFTTELLRSLEKKIEEEVKKNKDDLPPEEKREKAKKIIHKKLLKQIVGATTGALIGALLGVVVAFTSAVTIVKASGTLKPMLTAAGGAAVARGAAAAVETAVAGGAAAVVETVVAGGAAAAVETAVAGGAAAAVETAVAGGAAAVVETAVAGGAAAAVETAVAGGAAQTGVAAAAGPGTAIAAGVLGGAALTGAVVGGVTGWKAGEEADSVYDAMIKAAAANYENAKTIIEKINELNALFPNKKTE